MGVSKKNTYRLICKMIHANQRLIGALDSDSGGAFRIKKTSICNSPQKRGIIGMNNLHSV